MVAGLDELAVDELVVRADAVVVAELHLIDVGDERVVLEISSDARRT